MAREDRSSGAWDFIAGAVIGGAIGAGVALLFAPRSGEETRKVLKKKAENLGKEFDEFKKDVGPKIKAAKDKIAKKFSS